MDSREHGQRHGPVPRPHQALHGRGDLCQGLRHEPHLRSLPHQQGNRHVRARLRVRRGPARGPRVLGDRRAHRDRSHYGVVGKREEAGALRHLHRSGLELPRRQVRHRVG